MNRAVQTILTHRVESSVQTSSTVPRLSRTAVKPSPPRYRSAIQTSRALRRLTGGSCPVSHIARLGTLSSVGRRVKAALAPDVRPARRWQADYHRRRCRYNGRTRPNEARAAQMTAARAWEPSRRQQRRRHGHGKPDQGHPCAPARRRKASTYQRHGTNVLVSAFNGQRTYEKAHEVCLHCKVQ